jgi:hypothetical protein
VAVAAVVEAEEAVAVEAVAAAVEAEAAEAVEAEAEAVAVAEVGDCGRARVRSLLRFHFRLRRWKR